MNRTPNKWIAAVLGLLLQPLGLVYVARPIWAVFYIAAMLGAATAIFSFPQFGPKDLSLDLAVLSIAFTAAAHAYLVAARFCEGDPRPAYTRWYGLVGIVMGFSLLSFLFRGFVMEPFRLPANSMAPSYPKGTYILVTKWGYGHYQSYGVTLMRTKVSRPLARADLIVFDYPEDPVKSFIKRVIGLPGDKVAYRDKRLSLNGVPVATHERGGEVTDGSRVVKQFSEKLGETPHLIWVDDSVPPLRLSAVRRFPAHEKCVHDTSGLECEVPAGNYFVLGDNRDNSDDSRYWGFVPETAVIGKVWHAFVPK